MSTHTSNPAAILPIPVSLRETLPGKAVLAVAGSLLVAAAAHLSVPLPFTPVPLTFSDLAVLLVGLTLGPSTAFTALALYLMEGASGMPVFAPSGPGGIAQLFGVTGGYLLSYPFAAALAGSLFARLRRLIPSPFAAAFTGALAGSTLLMVCGVVWLGALLHLTAGRAFHLGALPFLPGQAIKIVAAASIAGSLGRFRRG
jgi:biotin transport system substrate-specific component